MSVAHGFRHTFGWVCYRRNVLLAEDLITLHCVLHATWQKLFNKAMRVVACITAGAWLKVAASFAGTDLIGERCINTILWKLWGTIGGMPQIDCHIHFSSPIISKLLMVIWTNEYGTLLNLRLRAFAHELDHSCLWSTLSNSVESWKSVLVFNH